MAIKVDVDTFRGTCEGVPRLVAILGRHGAGATFLFSLGPDHTGRAIRRAFRSGFLSKVKRTSVLEHYGLRTLLYGTLLPGPDIGSQCAPTLRAVRQAGFEVGIHCWDHVRWQDGVCGADAAWIARELRRADQRFREIFGEGAQVHGAAGWQMNAHAFALLDALGFGHASDTRGTHPFLPVCDGRRYNCPQIPTTLPTLDELIGANGVHPGNVSGHLLDLTDPRPLHVFTAHAELEGGALSGAFDALLSGWKSRGFALVSLGDCAAELKGAALPRHAVIAGTVPGRSGMVAMQGQQVF